MVRIPNFDAGSRGGVPDWASAEVVSGPERVVARIVGAKPRSPDPGDRVTIDVRVKWDPEPDDGEYYKDDESYDVNIRIAAGTAVVAGHESYVPGGVIPISVTLPYLPEDAVVYDGDLPLTDKRVAYRNGMLDGGSGNEPLGHPD